MTSLLDMNDLALEKILRKLDIRTILILRQVCHGLRNFIDDANLKTDLQHISITITAGTLIKVDMKDSIKIMKPQYTDVHQASEDLMSILYLQKSKIPTFSLYFEKMNEQFLANVEKALKLKPRPLQVENFNLRISNSCEILQILPYIDLKCLKSINIFPTNEVIEKKLDDIDRIMELEQFKKAKIISISGFLVNRSMKNFLHMERFYGVFDGFPVEEIMTLKEAFIEKPHIKSFGISGHLWDRTLLEKALNAKFRDSGDGMESINFRCKDGNILIIEFIGHRDSRLNFIRIPLKRLGEHAIIN